METLEWVFLGMPWQVALFFAVVAVAVGVVGGVGELIRKWWTKK